MAANPQDKSKTIRIVDDHEVTSLEKITRLIFGGIFGAGVGGFFSTNTISQFYRRP